MHSREVSCYNVNHSRGDNSTASHCCREVTRREQLRKAAAAIFDEDLEDKVLSFDAAAAARRKQANKPIGQLDAMIVGIAQAHQSRLATRNIRNFVDCEIQLVDPWNLI